ncbi:MAG: VCBS repeat-containing protein [Pyrinomonadaceae bacterium]
MIALAASVSGGVSARGDDGRPWPPQCDPGLPLNRCYTPGDYDGDRKADLAMFRPAEGVWHVKRSSNNEPYAIHWGLSDDKLVPADYDGDGKDDFAVYRKPATNASKPTWYIRNSTNGQWRSEIFGSRDASPAPADYDGDGRADLAVALLGSYEILHSSDNSIASFHLPIVNRDDAPVSNHNDIVVPADYDGDGMADPAIYDERPEGPTSHGGPRVWVIRRSSDGVVFSVPFGGGDDVPVPGDYNSDGKTDIAVWHPDERLWSIIENLNENPTGYPVSEIIWGEPGDLVVPADYDGDGKTDPAVWRPGEGIWEILYSSSNESSTQYWGLSSDIPVPMFLKRLTAPNE